MNNDNRNPTTDADHDDLVSTVPAESCEAESNAAIAIRNQSRMCFNSHRTIVFLTMTRTTRLKLKKRRPQSRLAATSQAWVIRHRLAEHMKPIVARKPHCLLIEVPDRSWCVPLAAAIRGTSRETNRVRPKQRSHAHARRWAKSASVDVYLREKGD